MLFFGKSKVATDPAQPKRRSTFGLLFNPEIGKSLQPLGETTNVFVQLIAMIFAMNGLFPKNHPAIQGVEGAKLSLTEIFSTAWNDLTFTKAGLPKIILFFAVTGTLILAVLSMITALMAGFMGTAHAAGGGASTGFFAPSGSDDLAQGWLDYIFKGQPLSDYYAQNGQPIAQSTGIQCSLITALGFYSSGMLIFAAVILFYHLISMVVNTAHEGVAMGKRTSQVWAPIRLVVAVGLLIPMGSGGTSCSYGPNTSTAGLNAGQYIVIQMASWGSGLASQTWSVFVNSLSDRGRDYIQPSIPEVTAMVKNITLMEACKFAWNYNICTADIANNGGDPSQCAAPNSYSSATATNELIATPTPSWTDDTTGDLHIEYYPKSMIAHDKICGSIIISGPSTVASAQANKLVDVADPQGGANIATIAKALEDAHKTTLTGMLSQFATVGAKIAMLIPEQNQTSISDNTDYFALVNQYRSTLKQNLDAALKKAGNSQLDATTIASLGWAGAGAWLNTISRDQGAIVNAYENGLPKTERPSLGELVGNSNAQQIAAQLANFSSWIDHKNAAQKRNTGCDYQAAASVGAGSATSGKPDTSIGDNALSDATKTGQDYGTGLDLAKTKLQNLTFVLSGTKPAQGESIVDQVFGVIDAEAARTGVWNDTETSCPKQAGSFTLGSQLVTSNPLQEFSFWGHASLRAAYALWEDIMDLSVASAMFQTEKEVTEFTEGRNGTMKQQITEMGLKSQYYGFVASILGMFATLLMTAGFSVAFVAPLIPYFRFFFNVLTWIVSTLEAVVAIPLLALAHLNPEGEGLPGQSAKAGYFMIFNIFVRPVLTVFGLIAGLVIFYVAIMLLNMTFAIAVAGTNAASHNSYETLIRIAFTVTYAAAVYTCANNAFKTIGFFPEHAMRWIGAQAHHERMGDGGRTIQGALGQTQAVLGEKALGVIRLKS